MEVINEKIEINKFYNGQNFVKDFLSIYKFLNFSHPHHNSEDFM